MFLSFQESKVTAGGRDSDGELKRQKIEPERQKRSNSLRPEAK
jgi:hypothetical protein